MIASRRLKKGRDRLESLGPYLKEMEILMQKLSRGMGEEHPLFRSGNSNKAALLLISSQRGLCGGHNSRLFKYTRRLLEEHRNRKWIPLVVGKQGVDFFKHRGLKPLYQWIEVETIPGPGLAGEISDGLLRLFRQQGLQEVKVLYSSFITVFKQQVKVLRLLPLHRSEGGSEPLFEPGPVRLFASFLPDYLSLRLQGLLLESRVSESAARMMAMEAATENAGQLLEELEGELNRLRQREITAEIAEIMGGAEALRAW